MKIIGSIFVILGLLVYAKCDSFPDTSDSNICLKCHCKKQQGVVDCSYLRLTDIFPHTEWNKLKATGMNFTYVNFRNNNIKNVTVFPEISIKHLDLSYNMISNIVNAAFENITNLEILDLSNNQIKSKNIRTETFQGKYSPDDYEPVPLKKLNLAHNQIHTLDGNIFEHISHLEELILTENPFRMINLVTTQAISSLNNLKVLNISGMELETIPDDIFHGPKDLEQLDLSGNLLYTLPNGLRYAKKLTHLNLDNNLFIEFNANNTFPELPNLKYLSISHCIKLGDFGKESLSKLPELTSLSITHNPKLSYINEFAMAHDNNEHEGKIYPSLKELRLNNNRLNRLDREFVSQWENLDYIDISNNPWSCDCNNQWIVDYLLPLLESKKLTHLIEHVVCEHPKPMAGIHFSELAEHHSKMRCLDKYGAHPERDSVILISVLIILLLGIIVLLVFMFLRRNGYVKCCGNSGPADYSRRFYNRSVNEET